MSKHEFEKLAGEKVGEALYAEIEKAYMRSPHDKAKFVFVLMGGAASPADGFAAYLKRENRAALAGHYEALLAGMDKAIDAHVAVLAKMQ